MARRLKVTERIQVEEKDGKPHRVQGRLVSENGVGLTLIAGEYDLLFFTNQ